MITPYLPTLNLSVDNALSLSQIVHQLITQLNSITMYINELDLGVDEKISEELKLYDERLQVQLEALQETLSNAISETVANCKNYTDLKSEKICETINTLEMELKSYVDKYNEIQDNEIEVLKLAIESLRIDLDEINKKTNSAVSPLTGTSKSFEDCMFDSKTCAQTLYGMSVGDILRLLYTQDNSNRVAGTWKNNITLVGQALTTGSQITKNMFNASYTNAVAGMRNNWRNLQYFTRQCVMNLGKSLTNVSDGEFFNGKVSYTIGQTIGLDNEYANDAVVALPQWTSLKDVIVKDELQLAKDLGLLNDDYTIKTRGEYPL